jgi:hypothetical protein
MRTDLEKEFPQFDFSLTPLNEFWWYIPPDRVVSLFLFLHCIVFIFFRYPQVLGETLEEHKKRFKELGGWKEPIPHVAGRVSEFEKFLVERYIEMKQCERLTFVATM